MYRRNNRPLTSPDVINWLETASCLSNAWRLFGVQGANDQFFQPFQRVQSFNRFADQYPGQFH
jgi:hypothetical protein